MALRGDRAQDGGELPRTVHAVSGGPYEMNLSSHRGDWKTKAKHGAGARRKTTILNGGVKTRLGTEDCEEDLKRI